MLLSSATVSRWLQLVLLLLALVLLVSGIPEERHLSVYSNAANYSVAVQQRNGVGYVSLLEVLEPLGTVSAKVSHHHWKLRFDSVDGEFTEGKPKAKVRGASFDLPAGFVLEEDRGLVPLSCLAMLLPRFLGGPVTFHEAARRLFVGDAAIHFTAQIAKNNPPTLAITFSSPVNPTIATEAGRLSMKFVRDGVVGPDPSTITFDSKAISSAAFQENNGEAELVISGAGSLMATFSNNNRTITIAALQPPAAVAVERAAPPAGAASPAPPNPAETPRYFAVIDPAHGGSETGAALGSQLLEKDFNLALARALRQELAARKLNALLARDSDVTLTGEQRASLVNAVHPAVYVCLHASTPGTGVRVFTSLLPPASGDQGPFVQWDTAQSAFLAASQNVAVKLQGELRALQVPIHSLAAPLHPLNSVRAAAVAIEIAPPNSKTGLDSSAYQQSVARLVATALSAMHDELEGGR